jgi:outer membrane protein assembly factor BamB
MIRKILITITALIGILFIILFLWMKTPVQITPLKAAPRFGTIQLGTSELGEPAYVSGKIVVGNAKGELRVFKSVSAGALAEVIPMSKSAIIAPVFMKNNVCFVGDEDGKFWAYDLAKGIKWTYKTGNKITGAAQWYDDLILVGSYDQNLYAFEPESGKLRYKVECESFINGSPVCSESAKAIFFGSCDGILREIETESGKVVGEIDLGSPIPASPVLYDDILYLLTHDGELVAVRTKPFSILYRMKLSGAYVSSPYIFDEFVFLTDSNGGITVHSRSDGKRLAILEAKENMTPLQTGDQSGFYAVSNRGKLYRYQLHNGQWARDLLHDFQTDCRRSCRLFGEALIIVDENGGLYFYEVSS